MTTYLGNSKERRVVALARLPDLAPSAWMVRVIREKRVDRSAETVRELARSRDDSPSREGVRAEPLAAGVGSARIG